MHGTIWTERGKLSLYQLLYFLTEGYIWLLKILKEKYKKKRQKKINKKFKLINYFYVNF